MSVWMPQIGEDPLLCGRELSNECDEYAVAIVAIDRFKREVVVGHVPLFLSKTLSSFACPDRTRAAKLEEQEQTEGIGVGLKDTNRNNFFCERNGD